MQILCHAGKEEVFIFLQRFRRYMSSFSVGTVRVSVTPVTGICNAGYEAASYDRRSFGDGTPDHTQ
jgi:hypothetical protein